MDNADFQKLLGICQKLETTYNHQIIFIGGIAVYLHLTKYEKLSILAETTHDADFYISISAMSDLRDDEEITPNLRLSKHQIIKEGFEFDIYTEHHSKLIVPFADVYAKATRHDDYLIACLEHLLSLKLEAYHNRRHSQKGLKDAKDILRIALCANQSTFKVKEYAKFQMPYHPQLLQEIFKGPASIQLSMGNAHQAKTFRASLGTLIEKI